MFLFYYYYYSETRVSCGELGGNMLSMINVLGLILLLVTPVTEGRTIGVAPDPNTIVIISRSPEGPECNVCKGEASTGPCNTELTLREPANTNVTFTCSNPEDYYTVEVNRELDCTEIDCGKHDIHPEASLYPDFNRTFTWDMKVQGTRAFQLDFPEPGMRQIPPEETCPNKHTYTITTYQRTGPATIGTFCRNGTISTIQVQYRGRVSLALPRKMELNPSNFRVSVGPETDKLLVVNASLPWGQSNTEFFTPNYPKGIPTEDLVRWNFGVPTMHNFSVTFLQQTEPQCTSGTVGLEYQQGNKQPIKKLLTDPQPANQQGNFSLTLSNCVTSKAANAPGLSLKFSVSAFRSGHPHVCVVDLQNKEGLSLQIENTNPQTYCELRMDSVVKEKIIAPAGTSATLSFLDCPSEELRLTATKTIECKDLSSCSVNWSLLSIPSLDSCLPVPLQQFTWMLRVAPHGTIDLSSPEGNLHHSLPGQECNGSISLLVSEAGGSNIGQFCSLPGKGIIRKIQIHSDVNIAATPKSGKYLGQGKGPFFNISFSPEISESMIYSVSLGEASPALLATPNWPGGMQTFSTVSWIVEIPNQKLAELVFANISQPKCDQRHTAVKVQNLGSPEEILSRREDEKFDGKVSISRSFYLNMSNCQPESGHFAVLSKVTLYPKRRKVLGIVVGVVAALLIIMVIILTVVCLVTRKKKRQFNTRSSIYIPRGAPFLPGDASFPKSRSDNESHVYASIDDTMVYGHLLGESNNSESGPDHFNGHQVDTYRTFTGPMDGNPVMKETPADLELETRQSSEHFLDPSESFIPSRPRTPLGPQNSLRYEDRRMMHNELNTFKQPTEPSTIILSPVEPEPEPEPNNGTDCELENVYDAAM
ncbi:CUB domain-containing protein 1 [Chanos chanos]|uniref:CUB domain-containing protein 1 n=1 Tax=Chanos chanos TaxID=29144 RepID=A0A6J2WKW7_CHACN|nr:CUB domain-containing protein 1-like [Chanos chanos]